MQRSVKKGGARELQEEYKSESSRASGAISNKQKFSLQNMKEFKYEIDHQIAKCLDTLDRQGLKFLKETLRASKLFALNTQQLNHTVPLEEEIDSEVPSPRLKNEPARKAEAPKNIQVKKGSKPQLQRKPATAQKVTRNTENRNDLGEKIHKKLESLNIKTGKKQESKPQGQKPKQIKPKLIVQQPSSTPQIAEEIETQENIEVQDAQSIRDNPSMGIAEEIKGSFVSASSQQSGNSRQCKTYESQRGREQKQQVVQNYYSLPREQQPNPLKPFCKKQYKKHHISDEKIKRDYGFEDIEHQPQEELNQDITKGNNRPEQAVHEAKIEQREAAEGQPDEERRENISLNQMTEEGIKSIEDNSIPMDLLRLIEKIKKLPTTKLQRLERVLERFEDPNLSTSMLSSASEAAYKETPYMKPYIPIPQTNQSEAKERSHSRSRLEKVEKASSIKSSMMKKNKLNKEVGQFTPENLKIPNSESRVQDESLERSLTAKGEGKGQPQVILGGRAQSNRDPDERLQSQQTFRPKEQSLSSSSTLNNQSGQKLIKIGKKKSTTNVCIKIISNNGHPSLVALSAILIYNNARALITIEASHLKPPAAKLLKLFTENNPEGWIAPLSSAVITLEGIAESIGGIRIINFNKSELQNNKQADLVEVLINQQLFWRGQLRGGSFKEDESYITDIRVASRQFEFPMYKGSLGGSQVREGKLSGSSWLNRQKLRDPEESSKGNAIVWLEKESISKIKEIQELEKNESKVKRIQSIRNAEPQRSLQQPELQRPDPFKPPLFDKPKEEKLYSLDLQISPVKQEKARIQESNDILGELSRSIVAKKKTNLTEEKKNEEEKALREKEKAREKEQDEEFEEIIKSLEKREKQEKGNNEQLFKEKERGRENLVIKEPTENKGKRVAQKNMDDFMKDSLFEDLNKIGNPKPAFRKPVQPEKQSQNRKVFESKKTVKNDLDDLIDELNDVVASEAPEETGEEFLIPELPQGNQLTMVLLSNWGNQQYIGLNGVEIFNSNGDSIKPTEIICSSASSPQLLAKLFKAELMTSDQSLQMRLPKAKKNVVLFILPSKTEIAGIRLWNYNGHRVHNNIGVKKCQLRLDNQYIFSGEVRQSLGSAEDADRHCQYILFTDNSQIIKKINEKDWVSSKRKNNEEEKMLFKSTLENFHRPPTRNDEETVKKDIVAVQARKEPFKLPKRMYFEYEPPQLPEGFTLKFILHSSWGDRFFIGLNGIAIFNDKGEEISRNVSKIMADPSSVSKLEGYERDKRVVGNLINGRNTTSADSDTWLTPLLSDVQKIEKGRSNLLMLDFNKSNRIAGINFYNYTKTPERGVRQIEVYLDNYLLYRGFLRKFRSEEGIIHTSISFTREPHLLEAIDYCPYNEDHLEQDVGLVNEGKVLRERYSQVNQKQNLSRPMTGKLLP